MQVQPGQAYHLRITATNQKGSGDGFAGLPAHRPAQGPSVTVWYGKSGASPPFTASVDYFFNNAFRIDPEDGLLK